MHNASNVFGSCLKFTIRNKEDANTDRQGTGNLT